MFAGYVDYAVDKSTDIMDVSLHGGIASDIRGSPRDKHDHGAMSAAFRKVRSSRAGCWPPPHPPPQSLQSQRADAKHFRVGLQFVMFSAGEFAEAIEQIRNAKAERILAVANLMKLEKTVGRVRISRGAACLDPGRWRTRLRSRSNGNALSHVWFVGLGRGGHGRGRHGRSLGSSRYGRGGRAGALRVKRVSNVIQDTCVHHDPP